MSDKPYPIVDRIEGHYDFCHPRETQAQYRFWLPEGAPRRRLDHCVNVGCQWDIGVRDNNWLDVAHAMLQDAKAMLYCGGLADLEVLVDYLEANETRFALAEAQDRVEQCRSKLAEAENELENWRKIAADEAAELQAQGPPPMQKELEIDNGR